METRLIVTPSKEIRRQGREILKGKWLMGFLMIIAAGIIAAIPSSLFITLCAPDPELFAEYDTSWIGPFIGVTLIGLAIAIILGGLAEIGVYKSFLNAARGGSFSFTDLKYGLGFIGKALGLIFMMFIRILLWSLLLIVPGIIASFRYSQAVFILIDDPSKGVNQCIEESKALMNGNKMKFFCLSLSFIGWMLLASIPDMIVENLFNNGIIDNGYLILTYIAALPVLFVSVYVLASYARFYQMLIGEKDAEVAQGGPDSYVLAQEAVPASAEVVAEEDIADAVIEEELVEEIPEQEEINDKGYIILDGKTVDEL